MALVSGYPHGNVLKGFATLGPYIREGRCSDNHFFFDCLAVCINMRPAPEKRKCWGWGRINLGAEAKRYIYMYHLCKFDKECKWTESEFSDQEVIDKLESSPQTFHIRLRAYYRNDETAIFPPQYIQIGQMFLTSANMEDRECFLNVRDMPRRPAG